MHYIYATNYTIMINNLFGRLICIVLILTTALNISSAQQTQPVTLTDDPYNTTLSNGIVTLIVKKANGNILSLKYHDEEMMGNGGGYWVMLGQSPGKAALSTQDKPGPAVFSVSKDPGKNGGNMGEITIRFPYTGQPNVIPMDIEI